jgi:hypothetical protein
MRRKSIDSQSGRWLIRRDHNQPTALAVSGKGATLDGLALMLGLDGADVGRWLGCAGVLRGVDGKIATSAAELAPDQECRVPNTVYALWAGDLGNLGKRVVGWDRDLADLRRFGFRVVAHDVRWARRRILDVLPYRCALATTPETILANLRDLSKARQLHGFFWTGHGGPEDLGLSRHVGVYYADIVQHTEYRLGFAILNGCSSAAAGRSIVSGSAGALFAGSEGLMVPPFATWHPRDLFTAGRQGTTSS